ncbi:Hypothetical predicted protein [Octopus vulgaris]|uniref:Uncharacterized protein n=1 Tax=Octopus vulgaris TaxID=6645 RepID=A0AA36BAV1_OCTVU|nr:Hypothetical predicted protein [Octopus vulgaris]
MHLCIPFSEPAIWLKDNDEKRKQVTYPFCGSGDDIMNRIFILLFLLQIVYSSVAQNYQNKTNSKFSQPIPMNKCEMGSRPSFDFCTPQIDPVKELKLNETVKNILKALVSAWTLESIYLENLNTSTTYRCDLDYPDADKKGCKLKVEDHEIKPTIPTTLYSSTQNIMTITTVDEQTDSEEDTSTSVFDTNTTSSTNDRTKTSANATSTKDRKITIILCSVLIPTIVLLCMLCIIVTSYKRFKSYLISEEMTEKSTTRTCLPEEIELQANNTLKQQAAKILPPNNAHSIRNDPCMMENELYSVENDLYLVENDTYSIAKDRSHTHKKSNSLNQS